MSIKKIAFEEVNFLSKTMKDYCQESEVFDEFISERPNQNGVETLVKNRQSVNRKILVERLTIQNKNGHENSLKNIELLKNDNGFTITTGHQLCLLTGPLFSIYKIISCINLSKKLNQEHSKNQFVPVFWMASEDHDFEEINHVNLYNKKAEWTTNQKGPVGRFKMEEFDNFKNEISQIIDNDMTKTAIGFYENSTSLAEAHRKLIDFLFGEHGLVILDADDRKLKEEMIPIFKDELLTNSSFKQVESTSKKLIDLGYKKQVNPREINLFYQETGLRERIVKEEGVYKVLNTNLVFSEEEIITELESNPEKFSPNVVMRPIYQEKILPNIAYVGGPGEIAYWLQLKEVFDYHKVNFPALVLRNSVLLITKNTKKKIEKLGLIAQEFFKDENLIVKEFINEVSEISFENEIKELEKVFELTKEKAIQVDFSLERSVIAELKKAQNSFNTIKSKVTKAEKNKHEIAINQIKSVKNSFFPQGNFQERQTNFLEFWNPGFIKNLTDNLNSLEYSITLIEV